MRILLIALLILLSCTKCCISSATKEVEDQKIEEYKNLTLECEFNDDDFE